jgi:hypothetical protein
VSALHCVVLACNAMHVGAAVKLWLHRGHWGVSVAFPVPKTRSSILYNLELTWLAYTHRIHLKSISCKLRISGYFSRRDDTDHNGHYRWRNSRLHKLLLNSPLFWCHQQVGGQKKELFWLDFLNETWSNGSIRFSQATTAYF